MAQEDFYPPNLDGFATRDELDEWAKSALLDAASIFPHRPDGYVTAVCQLAAYAKYKSTAMWLRAIGEIPAACWWESECKEIYKELPDYAKW